MTEHTCKKCGANLEADAAFCPVCGESTAKDDAAPAQEKSESGSAHMPAGDESPAYEAYPKTETSMPSIPDKTEPHSLESKEVCAAQGKDMPAEAALLQKTSETAASGAQKREKKAPRKRSGVARFFAGAGSVLITLILLISILATTGVYLVRHMTAPAQIQRVIYAADADAIYVDAITGEDVRLRTTLCDLISYNIPPVYQNAYHLDAKTISQLCGADFVRGFVAEKLCGYADSLFKGTDTGRMDEAELIAFLTENQTELSEILDAPLQPDDIQALSNLIMKGGFAEITDLEAAKTQSPLPFANRAPDLLRDLLAASLFAESKARRYGMPLHRHRTARPRTCAHALRTAPEHDRLDDPNRVPYRPGISPPCTQGPLHGQSGNRRDPLRRGHRPADRTRRRKSAARRQPKVRSNPIV